MISKNRKKFPHLEFEIGNEIKLIEKYDCVVLKNIKISYELLIELNKFVKYIVTDVNLMEDPFNFPRPYYIFPEPIMVWKTEQLLSLDWMTVPENPTVLITILARNKAHVLPDFLKCIVAQDYPKDRISIYIRTNDNRDETKEVLTDWVVKHKEEYMNIEMDGEDFDESSSPSFKPHEWNSSRFIRLGKIREVSMKKALDRDLDYYFVVDCDNFIKSFTLSHLIKLRRPIVAPMLWSFPKEKDFYSNYFAACDDNGFYQNHDLYYDILYRRKIDTFNVPVVHCTYLIDSRYIPLLRYLDGSGTYEFVVFSRRARLARINQYITNEKEFGLLLHPPDDVTLEEEKCLFDEYKEKCFPFFTKY
jgi:hypothetical protein